MARTKTLLVRMNEGEMAVVSRKAAEAGEKVSDWVRSRLLDEPAAVQAARQQLIKVENGRKTVRQEKAAKVVRRPVPAVIPMKGHVGTKDAGMAAVLSELKESGERKAGPLCPRCQRVGLSECSVVCRSQQK